MITKLAALTLFFTVLISGCTSRSSVLVSPTEKEGAAAQAVELIDTPYFPQKSYQCGPAALATVLQSSNINVVPHDLVSQVYIPEKKGSLQIELIATARRYERIPYKIAPDLQALFAELRAGRPVLVLQNLGLNVYPVWHYAVVIGYEPWSERIILRSGTTHREMMSTKKFIRSWQRSDFWGIVMLHPGELPAIAESGAYLKEIAALEAAGKSDAALLSYKAALQRWPRNEVALLGAGNVHYARGEFREAETAYRQLLEVNPDHAVASNNLALLLAEQGCYNEALTEIDKVLAISSAEATHSESFMDTRKTILNSQRKNRLIRKGCLLTRPLQQQ